MRRKSWKDIKRSVTTFADLEKYANDVSESTGNSLLPITRSRARCWLKNPNASPSDPAIVTFISKEDGIICYFGLMPFVSIIDGIPYKVYWASTGAVAPTYRDGTIGRLMNEFVRETGIIFCSNGISVSAAQMFRGNGFMEFSGVNGLLFPVHALSLKFLVKKLIGSRRKSREEYFTDIFMMPRFTELLLRRFGFELRLREDQLSEGAQKLFSKQPITGHFRGPAVINWMLSTPWWPHVPALNDVELKYMFNWAEKKIAFRSIDFISRVDGRVVASFVISYIKDPEAKVKILDFTSEKRSLLGVIVMAGLEISLRLKVQMLYLPLELMTRVPLYSVFKRICRQSPAPYFALSNNEELVRKIMQIELRQTDGDTSFW